MLYFIHVWLLYMLIWAYCFNNYSYTFELFFGFILSCICRFQRHVHTYRILPDAEGLLAVQVSRPRPLPPPPPPCLPALPTKWHTVKNCVHHHSSGESHLWESWPHETAVSYGRGYGAQEWCCSFPGFLAVPLTAAVVIRSECHPCCTTACLELILWAHLNRGGLCKYLIDSTTAH